MYRWNRRPTKGGWRAAILGALVTLTVVSPTLRVQAADEPAVSAKALKYYEPLRKRPEPGYLYDRFYNTWLDEATVDDLQKFLVAKAGETKSTTDQLLLAYFYAKQGDDSAALEAFRRALTDNPGSAEAWFQKAAAEARALDFETAIADLRKARELKPDEKLAVLIDKQLGRMLVRNRQADEAVKLWSALLAARPGDEELAEDLLELHIDEGLFEEAAKLAEAMLARTKDPYLAVTRRLRLGDVHQRAGSREKALAAYSQALGDVGQNSWLEQEILAQTEQLFRREDSLSQLKEHYKKLFETHGRRIALHRRYAKLLVELGEQDEAIAAYKKILELTPGDRANREEYVEVLAKIGRKDQAIDELRALCEQNAKDAELRFRLATLLNEASQKDQSAAEIRNYLAASDKSEYAYLRAARALERFELKDAAAEVYREMAAATPDSASAQEAYAAFLYGAGKKPEAIEIYRKLADGAELGELLHVARALAAREEYETALELLQAREAEFKKEPLYFSQLAATAIALKKPELALPWVQRRVELAENTSELEAALDQAVAACDRADKIEEVAQGLAALPQRGVPQSCLLAELYEAAGDSRAADETLAAAAASGNILAVSEQIRLFNQRRDWSAAAEATRKLLELPGGRKSIHVRRLVELYQRNFQVEEALPWIAEWKRLSPGSTLPWTTEAALLRMQGKDDAAVAVMKSAVQKFEEDEDLRVRLAQLYGESNHAADAERIYWQLYDDTEDVAGKLRWAQELAKICEQLGKLPQLVENLEERRRSNRQSIVPLLALAEVHREADNYEGRRQALTAAAKIKPDDLELLHHIARVEEQEGDWNAAVETLTRASEIDKTNRTKERIARLHLTYGDAEDGFAILFELAGEKDRDPRTLEAIADAMCGTGEWKRAVELLAPQVIEQPGDYRLRYLLAVAHEECGDEREAIEQFLVLLEDQEELPEVSKKPGLSASINSYFDMVRKMAPPSVVECMELAQYRYTAYQHQQQRGGVYFSGGLLGGGAAATKVQMPSKVELCRPMALAHLATLAQQLEEEQTSELVRSMHERGVKSAELLVRIGPEGYYRESGAEFEEYLAQHPDDEVGLALVVLRQFSRQQSDLEQYAEKAIEVFRKPYPELALMAAVQCGVVEESERALGDEANDGKEGAANERTNEHFETALAIANEIESPSPMTVIGLAQTLGGLPQSEGDRPSIPQAYREKFSKLMIAWYPHLRSSPQYGQWAFTYVVGTLTRGDDPSSLIAFLEDEVAQYGGGGNQRQQAAMMGVYRQPQQQLFVPLGSPPVELADFPPTVLVLLRRPESDPFASIASISSPFAPSGQFEFAADKARPLVEKVRHPVLRTLLAMRLEFNDLADKTLREMLAAEQPQLDAYLLAAGKAVADQKHAEAVDLLSKARYLPMDREMRSRVDAAIVASVTEAKGDKQVVADEALTRRLVEAGQAACLRLRQSRLDANKRNELIAAMEDLGLKREAEKLDQLAASQPSGGGGTVRAAMPIMASPGAQDRIAKLVAEGKRDAAVKLLAAEVLGQVRQVLANPQNGSYMRYQFRQVKQRTSALGLADELMKSLDPGDSENPQRLSEYAVVCEMFDKPDVARQAYERLIAKRPKDDAARVRLVMLMGPEEVAAAQQHLKLLNPNQSQSIGQMFIEQMQDNELDPAVRVTRAELAVAYLRTLAEAERAQTGWAGGLVQMIAHEMYARNGRNLPSLYTKKQENNEKLSEEQTKLHKRRSEVHRALCDEMLKHADCARAGFTHLLAATEARGEQIDGFALRATTILRDEAQGKPSAGNNPYANYTYFSNDANRVRLQSPEEFLVRTAAASGDWKAIDQELLPALERGRNKNAAKVLAQMEQLYRCPAEEFLGVAQEVVRQRPGANAQDQADDLAIVVAAWQDRKLDADLSNLAVERLKRLAKSPNHYQMPACVSQLIETTYELRGGPKTLELLEEITTIYLGPAAKRKDFLAKYNTNNGISWGQPSGQIYVYNNFMSQLLQRRNVLPTVLAYLQGVDGPSIDNLEYYAESGVSELARKKPAEALAMLAGSPWLAELDAFHPLDVGARNRGQNSWLAHLLKTAGEVSQEHQKELAAAVAERYAKTPTFGLGLIDSYLKGEAALLEYAAERLEALRQVEEPRQSKIAGLIAALAAEELKKPAAPQKYGELKQWLEGSSRSATEQLLEKVRQAKRLEELVAQPWESGEYLAGVLGDKIGSDPALASEVFFRFLELAHDAQKRNQWNYYFGSSSSTAAYLLRDLSQRPGRENLSRLALIAAIVGNDKGVNVEYEDGDNYGIDEALRRHLQESLDGKGTAKLTAVEAVKQLHSELGTLLGNRSGSLFIDSYYEAFRNQFSGDRQEDLDDLAAWAQEAQGQDAHPRLAGDFAAALAMCRADQAREKAQEQRPGGNVDNDNGDEGEGDDEGQKEGDNDERSAGDPVALSQQYRAYFAAEMASKELPIGWRMHLAGELARFEGERLPADLGGAALDVLAEAIDSGVAIPGNQQRALVEWISRHADEAGLADRISAFQERWANRFLRAASSAGAQRFEKLDEVNDSRVLTAALAVYLKRGDEPRVHLLLRRYDSSLSHDPLVLLELLRAKRPELAARFLRAHWTDVSIDWPNSEDARYDESIAAQVGPLCEQLNRDDEKFFARSLMAAMHDGPSDKPPAGDVPTAASNREAAAADKPAEPPPRDQRMLELAGEFAAVTFTDDGMRMRSLALLARSRPASERLRDPLAQQYQKLNLALAFPQDDPRQWNLQAELAQRHLANELRRGDVRPFVELFDALAKLVDGQNYQTVQRIESILRCGKEAMLEDCSGWTVEQYVAMGRSLRQLLIGKEYVPFNYYSDYSAMLVAAHVRGQAAGELAEWREKLSRNARANFQNRGVNGSLWQMLKSSIGAPTPENLTTRLATAEGVVGCLADLEWLNFHHDEPHHVTGLQRQQSVYKHLIDAKLLTREELLAHASQIDPLPPRHFMVNLTLAEWLAAEKAYRPAAALYEASLAKMPDTWKIRRIHWTLNAAAAWAEVGELDKARQLAEQAMTLEGVRDAERKKHDRVMALIEKKASGGDEQETPAAAPATAAAGG
ncbi:MAG: tetratricopeptide repeat protein [Pirellulales bacterium]|nr:tetratricopeptide repeat protein [Pirellulales bacterium]